MNVDVNLVAVVPFEPTVASALLEEKRFVHFRREDFAFPVSHVVVYVGAPVKRIVGWLELEAIHEGTPEELWSVYGLASGMSQRAFARLFRFADAGVALQVRAARLLEMPRTLSSITTALPPLREPLYLKPDCIQLLADPTLGIKDSTAAVSRVVGASRYARRLRPLCEAFDRLRDVEVIASGYPSVVCQTPPPFVLFRASHALAKSLSASIDEGLFKRLLAHRWHLEGFWAADDWLWRLQVDSVWWRRGLAADMRRLIGWLDSAHPDAKKTDVYPPKTRALLRRAYFETEPTTQQNAS